MLCFALDSRYSIDHVKQWRSEIDRYGTAANTGSVVLVGLRSDNEKQREVTREEAQALADEIGATYVETSSKTGDGVEHAFCAAAAVAARKIMTLNGEDIGQPAGPTPPAQPQKRGWFASTFSKLTSIFS